MPTLVAQPTRISAAGTKPKLIDEYIGRVNTETAGVSVAYLTVSEIHPDAVTTAYGPLADIIAIARDHPSPKRMVRPLQSAPLPPA